MANVFLCIFSPGLSSICTDFFQECWMCADQSEIENAIARAEQVAVEADAAAKTSKTPKELQLCFAHPYCHGTPQEHTWGQCKLHPKNRDKNNKFKKNKADAAASNSTNSTSLTLDEQEQESNSRQNNISEETIAGERLEV